MTGEGTNTYIIGKDDLCIIDPGPDNEDHLEALLDGLRHRGTLRMILVTHSHLDHSSLARKLAEHTGATVHAFGDSSAGRSSLMNTLAHTGHVGGGEGVDLAFYPDQILKDFESIRLGNDLLSAIWTPGHFGNHLCFAWRGAVFTGDHVMGWSSTFVSPPDGDISAYMRSLDRLEAESPRRLYPGHGAPVDAPLARIAELRAHRLTREGSILRLLASGARTIPQIVAEIYTETPPLLRRAAGRNVFAHLIDLQERGLVKSAPALGPEAIYWHAERE